MPEQCILSRARCFDLDQKSYPFAVDRFRLAEDLSAALEGFTIRED
jgi:hypothetical protein